MQSTYLREAIPGNPPPYARHDRFLQGDTMISEPGKPQLNAYNGIAGDALQSSFTGSPR
jgi:hypothetical protein